MRGTSFVAGGGLYGRGGGGVVRQGTLRRPFTRQELTKRVWGDRDADAARQVQGVFGEMKTMNGVGAGSWALVRVLARAIISVTPRYRGSGK